MKGGRPLADLEPKWQQLAARFLMVIMMSKRTQHTQIATSCMNAFTCNPIFYASASPPHPQTASHVSLAHKCCAGWASSSAGGLPKGGAPPGLSCEHNTYPMCFSKHKPRLNKHAVVQPTSWPTNVGLTHSPLAGHPPYSNACTRNLRHPASLG